jgi:hypothetical protein
MRQDELIEDRCYFLVTYHDEALRLPAIATYVYVRKNIFGAGSSASDTRLFF